MSKFAAWLDRQSRTDPRWWWPVVRIYGSTTENRTCYMTRVVLLHTRWGSLYLHVFHREDIDRDPHDHPFAFWTLPLNQGYYEHVYSVAGNCFRRVFVPRGRWTRRAATHTHRIDGTEHDTWPLVTLVWRGPTVRKWGFWCRGETSKHTSPNRYWVDQRRYLGDDLVANVEGEDVLCPGRIK